MHRSLSLVLSLSLIAAPGAFAARPAAPAPDAQEDAGIQRLVVRSGKYTFWIDVRNRHFRSVDQARATVYVSGDRSARITVRADGYRDASGYVSLNPNRTSYNVRVTLEDPTVWYEVRDETYAPISHYSRADNFGVWGDEFRVVSRIDAEGYTRFDQWDVEVRVNGGIPFGERVRVTDLGDTREVEVTFKRRDLTSFSNRVELRIPSDESLPADPPADDPPPADSQSRWRHQAFTELHRDPVD